jgi:hypothetical protein
LRRTLRPLAISSEARLIAASESWFNPSFARAQQVSLGLIDNVAGSRRVPGKLEVFPIDGVDGALTGLA